MNGCISTRAECLARDASDPLASLRDQFDLDACDADGIIYLDGNSLGPRPRQVDRRLTEVSRDEWGRGLIRSWRDAGWLELPRRLGDRIAPLIGAEAGQVVVADSTTVNLYKCISAAIALAKQRDPRRSVVLIPNGEFPTDRYVAATLAEQAGLRLETQAALDSRVAVVISSHVDYRTGALRDLEGMTQAAHAAGALIVWDLAHSAGVIPIDLPGADADFAVGCGYKFLNGGPGAPAFLWCHPRLLSEARSPIPGWMGHRDPFAFSEGYEPAPDSGRFLCGTPPILSMTALACGVETVRAADPFGGVKALREKAMALTELFRVRAGACFDEELVRVVSPVRPEERGSQVSLGVAPALCDGGGARALVEGLADEGVIADYRPPTIARFGFSPLYTRFVDVWDSVERMARHVAGRA